MEQIIPALMILGFVAIIMSKQINRVTKNLDNKQSSTGYSSYAKFSAVIQDEIREIKNQIDSSKIIENRHYILLEGKNESALLEILSDYIRKLVFFETLMAKQKSAQEIEADLFEILSGMELFLKENCVDGEMLADALRERLLNAYEQI
ncbi:MAG: hypothetical protein PHN18_12840 [Sulfurospirillaceae bacterium]|jgi:hypothetical protein|nr:hypothetical protein [Sulfurospirillaceae bacterium]MDD2827748.1 hypothetical protein [Sulfurospirillaceae bacterium]